MATRTPTWGDRVAGLMQGVDLHRPPTGLRNTVSEIVSVQFTPLTVGNQVAVARAIKAQGTLLLTSDGTLMTEETSPPLDRQLERRIRDLGETTYQVEYHWDILRRHPRVYCVSPIINGATRPQNRHLFSGIHPFSTSAQPLCIYPPHYGLLNNPRADDPIQLLIWTASYLACDAIQEKTGVWTGPEASHDRKQILKKYGHSECWCGSGFPMARCHGHQPIFGRPLNLRSL